MTGTIVQVRRQWDDFRIATYRIEDIGGLHWSDESGGVHRTAPRAFVHGYVMCDAMIAGELAHSCSHGPGPHRVKVCLTKTGNEMVWDMILQKLGDAARSQRQTSATKARADVEALARGLRAAALDADALRQRRARRKALQKP